MKKELVFEELTLDQKLGMLLCANIVAEKDPENLLKMIREHKIGAVYFGRTKREEHAAMVNAAAEPAMTDAPSLLIADCSMMFETEKTTPWKPAGRPI